MVLLKYQNKRSFLSQFVIYSNASGLKAIYLNINGSIIFAGFNFAGVFFSAGKRIKYHPQNPQNLNPGGGFFVCNFFLIGTSPSFSNLSGQLKHQY